MWCPCYAELCPGCGDDPPYANFAVVIDDDVIASVHPAPIGYAFPDFPTWTPIPGTADPEPIPVNS